MYKYFLNIVNDNVALKKSPINLIGVNQYIFVNVGNIHHLCLRDEVKYLVTWTIMILRSWLRKRKLLFIPMICI